MLATSELGDQLEIVPVMDGWTTEVKPDPRVRVLQLEQNVGMKESLNEGFKFARGEYIMKLDAHCAVGQGFDRIMVENMKDNWLMVPRMYVLDEKKWTRSRRPHRDYFYFNYPKKTNYGVGIWAQGWPEMDQANKNIEIDDLMAVQGSCFIAHREYFLNHVNFSKDFGPFAGEQLEITLGYWLKGGEVKVNKKTWYAHLFKRKEHYASGLYARGYKVHHKTIKGHTNAAKVWMRPDPTRKSIEWLAKRFNAPTW